MLSDTVLQVCGQFRFEGTLSAAEELRSGNINTTYHLTYQAPNGAQQYILQRINTYVFKNPLGMMQNISRVTDHLRHALAAQGVDPRRRVLEIILTRAGDLLLTGSDGSSWRAYRYIDNAVAYDQVGAPLFYQVGRGFGQFQRLLADYPADQLFESIPSFHQNARRFDQLMRAVQEDRAGRAKGVRREIAFVLDRREMLCSVALLAEQGVLPLRVTHNDTKSNNVMLDRISGEPLCVIDLDTVMPGSVLYDYGDAIRFGGSTAAEDEPDTAKIALDLDKTRAFTQGFLEETGASLTREELDRLPLGIKIMTGEMVMRFLADYLNGDVYFKTDYPEHNLVRTRAQMALLEDVERKEDLLRQMILTAIG